MTTLRDLAISARVCGLRDSLFILEEKIVNQGFDKNCTRVFLLQTTRVYPIGYIAVGYTR
jgi:hypothetical protein